MKTKFLLTVLFSIGIIGISNAQVGQDYRIRNGVRNGELTRMEAAKLHHEEWEINRDKRHAFADGRLSRRERRELRREQRRHNRHIAMMRHNRRMRFF